MLPPPPPAPLTAAAIFEPSELIVTEYQIWPDITGLVCDTGEKDRPKSVEIQILPGDAGDSAFAPLEYASAAIIYRPVESVSTLRKFTGGLGVPGANEIV